MSGSTESFFDTYSDTSGSVWVKAEEKKAMMEAGQTFPVLAVELEDHPEFGEGYVASVTLPDAEGVEQPRKIRFPKGGVESRDRMLDAMIKWLDDPSAAVPVVKLTKVGRSIIIVAA